MKARASRAGGALLGGLVLITVVVGMTWTRAVGTRAQSRIDDLAAVAGHYLWELDSELADQAGRVILDSERYRRFTILHPDGSVFLDLTPAVRSHADQLLEQLRLVPSTQLDTALLHQGPDGQLETIGTLVVHRRDTRLFVWLQLGVVCLLVGAAGRGWLERRRQAEAEHRLQLLQEKTTRLETEARLSEREQQLQEKRHLEALGRLSAGVAHDFNNMLTVIMATSEIISDEASEASTRNLAMDVLEAAERAARLTSQLLAFGRRQVLAPTPLDLNALVTTFLPLLERAAGDEVELHLELGQGLGVVMADASQMEQVLLNLVVNARNAMRDGGRLRIETCNLEGPAPLGDGPLLPEGHWVVLSVHDTGVGMDEETRRRAFEPFFTTRPEGKGTGLGLATVMGIMRQSGGEVCVESQLGQGSVVRVALPCVEDVAQPVPEALMSVPPGALNLRATLLLVEDRRQVREVMARALRSHGVEVLEAEDGLAALMLVRDQSAAIDMVLTDLTMPGIDGFELAQMLREDRPDLRVLFVSGDAAAGLPEDFVADARSAVLPKPFSTSRLVAHVHEMLGRSDWPDRSPED